MQSNQYGTKEKPEDLRQAYSDHFKTPSGKIRTGVKYWIHTYHTDRWEQYTTSENTKLERLLPWIKEKRVFVKNPASKKVDESKMKHL